MLLNEEKAVACHQIGMCTKTCPKGLDPKGAINRLTKLIEHQARDSVEVGTDI